MLSGEMLHLLEQVQHFSIGNVLSITHFLVPHFDVSSVPLQLLKLILQSKGLGIFGGDDALVLSKRALECICFLSEVISHPGHVFFLLLQFVSELLGSLHQRSDVLGLSFDHLV